MYSPPEFSGKKQHFHGVENKHGKKTPTITRHNCKCLQTLYAHSFSHDVPSSNLKDIHTHTLTEKYPVLLGVWPAALLSAEAHVCLWLCEQSKRWFRSLHKLLLTDRLIERLTGRPPLRVSRRAGCLSPGIETRQPFACDMGGWSVSECPADTSYCVLLL